ncbi:MAG: hypothetical protein C0521_05460 [Xanthomonas sp.]|nr:hypothetical protein [Xanthomonas sp.]
MTVRSLAGMGQSYCAASGFHTNVATLHRGQRVGERADADDFRELPRVLNGDVLRFRTIMVGAGQALMLAMRSHDPTW